jgi:hypothetical protein
VEKGRRLATEGKRVALMCYSRGLAEFLVRRVGRLRRRERPAYVGTFHNLGIGWGVRPGSDDDSAYWEEFLPIQMVSLAQALPEAERFDEIVIDEGRTSPRAGGTPSSRHCATPTTDASTSSRTRANASSRGRGGRPST